MYVCMYVLVLYKMELPTVLYVLIIYMTIA